MSGAYIYVQQWKDSKLAVGEKLAIWGVFDLLEYRLLAR